MARSNYLVLCTCMVLCLFVASCGGGASGGGSSGTSSSSSSQSSYTFSVLNSASGTVSSSSTSVSLSDVATVDFTGQADVIGDTVKISSVDDEELNGLADDQGSDFSASFADPKSVQISMSSPPSVPVPVKIFAPDAIAAATASQRPIVYMALIIVDASAPIDDSTVGDGDGENTIEPLASTIDAASNTISVNVPAQYFVQGPDGNYSVSLKVGMATTSSLPTAMATKSLQAQIDEASRFPAHVALASTIGTFTLPCPVSTTDGSSTLTPICVETSRYNPDRYLPKKGFRPHFGGDFRAMQPLPVFLPPGGKLDQERYVLPSEYVQYKGVNCNNLLSGGKATAASKKCSDAHTAGIFLVFHYNDYALKIMHLSDVSGSLLKDDRTLNTSAVTQAGVAIATTGQTGLAQGMPHLHMEVTFNGVVLVCYVGDCEGVRGRLDPFPYVATNLALSPPNHTKLVKGTAYAFQLTATDANGVPVTSNVGKPQENRGIPPPNSKNASGTFYDPTRKICFSSSNNAVIQFPGPDENSSFQGINNSYCVPFSTLDSTGKIILPASVSITAQAATPSTVITAGYSTNATAAIASDQLSGTTSTQLDGASAIPDPICTDTDMTFYAQGQTCSISFPPDPTYALMDLVLEDANNPGAPVESTFPIAKPSGTSVKFNSTTNPIVIRFVATGTTGDDTINVYHHCDPLDEIKGCVFVGGGSLSPVLNTINVHGRETN